MTRDEFEALTLDDLDDIEDYELEGRGYYLRLSVSPGNMRGGAWMDDHDDQDKIRRVLVALGFLAEQPA